LREDKINRGFLWNTSVYLISTCFSVAVNILVLPIYTRYLSPADYGIVILFVMFGNLSAGVLSANLHFASYMYYFQFKEDLNRFKIIYSTNALFILIIFLISGIFIYLFSGWLSSFLFEGRLTKRLILLSFISGCLEYLVLYMTTLLTAQVKSMQYAGVIVSRIIINTVFSFYFIFVQSLTHLALIYSIILSQGIIIIILFIAIRDLLGLRFSLSDLKMSLRLAYPLIPNSMIGLVYSSFDKTMLNKLKDINSVGYYSFGEKFSIILKAVQDAVSKSWEPYFMNKAHENSVYAREAIISRFYEIAFLFMIVGIGIIYFSEEIIKMLTTKAFYPSMYVVPLYIYFYLFAVMGTLSMNQISFSKKMAYLLPTSVCAVFINVALNIILIPKYGAVGAAGAIAISALSNNLLNLYFGMKLYPLPLGKWRLTKMYLIVIAFTVLIYPIMLVDIAVIVKIALKLALILSFISVGIKLHYISRLNILNIFAKIKSTAMNMTSL
jgi:O-antigen/teichoic acid export membrane protein